jgi:hypothetical protein
MVDAFADEKYVDMLGMKVPVSAIEVVRDLQQRIETIEARRDDLVARSTYLEGMLRQRNRQLLKARRRIAALEAPRKGWERYAKANGFPTRSEPPYSETPQCEIP